MVRSSNQGELYHLTTYWRGVLYEDSVKIDYSVWPVALQARQESLFLGMWKI